MIRQITRRNVLRASVALACAPIGGWARAAPATGERLLVLIELRGGNDGLNTLVPIDDPNYHRLRPRLALRGEAVVPLGSASALNASLAPWLPLWGEGELAILQGVGYPQPDLSHFRSIEIWDTASASDETVQSGWLTRTAAQSPMFQSAAADGVILGAADLGPFSGGARAVAMTDVQRFAAQSQLAKPGTSGARGALAHLLRVETDIARAATQLSATRSFATEFPRTPFGYAMHQAALIGASRRVPVVRVALNGFDTHQNQLAQHANLLRQVAEGVCALRSALAEAGAWDDTLILTYSEFGRRPRENGSGGTDHGTAGVQFALGKRVRGGMYGEPVALDRLDASGNVGYTLDFRRIYATVLARWWALDSRGALGATFAPVDFLAA